MARFIMRSAFLTNLLLFADVNIETPPSMHPCKRICDITGFEVIFISYYLLHINSYIRNGGGGGVG